MKKKGVTLGLLWEKYKTQHPAGYMYTQFCTKYREYRKKNAVYMRKAHKAGERMMVGWAGLTMRYAGENGNAKTAAAKANRYEAELNKSYQEMTEHYGIAIISARPYCATDKAPVETAVQIIERRIIAKLRHSQFLSLDELAEAFRAELEALNDQPFQKLPGSRRGVFLAAEQHEL
jgi:transposase